MTRAIDRCVGWDVISRSGDTSNMHDLIRAGAVRATAIIIMVNEKDEEGNAATDRGVPNSATLATLLAVRQVLLSSAAAGMAGALHPELRVSVQLSEHSSFIDEAGFRNRAGERIVQVTRRVVPSSRPSVVRVRISEDTTRRCR